MFVSEESQNSKMKQTDCYNLIRNCIMNRQDKIQKFWAEKYMENSDDDSLWVTFSEAYRKYKEYSIETDVTEQNFHSISSSHVKATKRKSPDHGERRYKVKPTGCSLKVRQAPSPRSHPIPTMLQNR